MRGSKPFQYNDNSQPRKVSPDERAKATQLVHDYIKLNFKSKQLNLEKESLKKGI